MAHMFCTLKQAADKLGTTEAEIRNMLDSGTLREFRDGSRRLLKVADLTEVEIVQRPASHREPPVASSCKAKSPQRRSVRPSGAATSSSGGAGQPSDPSAGQIKLPPTAAAPAAASCPSLRSSASSPHPAHPPARSKPAAQSCARAVVVTPVQTEPSATPEPDQEFSIEDLAYLPDSGDSNRRSSPSIACRSAALPSRSPGKPAPVVRRPAAARPSLPSPRRPYTHTMSVRQWLWMGLLDDQPFAILLLFAIVALALGSAAGAVYLLTQAF